MKAILTLGALLLTGLPAFCQERDLTGIWGTEKDGSKKVYTIGQDGTTVKIAYESTFAARSLRGSISSTAAYSPDGVERPATGANGQAVWTTVNWQGGALVILRVRKDGYRVAVTRESWSLSDDGATLARTLRRVDMDGVGETTEVFQRR